MKREHSGQLLHHEREACEALRFNASDVHSGIPWYDDAEVQSMSAQLGGVDVHSRRAVIVTLKKRLNPPGRFGIKGVGHAEPFHKRRGY